MLGDGASKRSAARSPPSPLPPFCIVLVPGDGLSQAGLEVGMDGPPAERSHELGRIDGVPPVVSGAIGDLVEGVSW